MSQHLNVQWKGTDACLDFTCSCGHYQHIDGITFAHITCVDTEDGKGCGKKWNIEHDATVLLREAT